MKLKPILLILLALTTLSLAQITGGGYSDSPTTVKKSGSKHLYESGHTDFGVAIPIGAFSDPSRYPRSIEPLGAVFGFKFNTGKLYYIKALENVLGSKFGLGIDVSHINIRMNFLNWDDAGYSEYGANYNIDLGVGVGFGFNAAEALSFDLYYRVDFGFAGFFSPTSSSSGVDVSGVSIFDGLLNALGVRMRYNKFVMAVDFRLGSLTFKNSSNSDRIFSDHKLSQSSLNISFGKTF